MHRIPLIIRTRYFRHFRIGPLAALLSLLAIPSAALAEPSTLHLKGGGFVRGEIMESVPDEHVSLRLADGTTRTVEWARIERIEQAGSPAGAPKIAPTPLADPARATLSPGGRHQRAMALDEEIHALETEHDSIRPGVPVVLMIVGGASAAFLLLPGMMVWAAGGLCEDSPSSDTTDCRSLTTTGQVMTVVGLAGSVVGLVGLVTLLNQSADKRELRRRITEKQSERQRLDLGVSAGPGYAGLRLHFAL